MDITLDILKYVGAPAAALLLAFIIYIQYKPPVTAREHAACPFTTHERDYIRDTKFAVGRLEEERHELTRILTDMGKIQVEIVHVVERCVLVLERVESRLNLGDLQAYADRRK